MLDYRVYKYDKDSVLPEMILDDLMFYRKSFLKRKNINGYKKLPNGTPIIIDKLINSFDRKIKSKKLFKDDVKIEYLKGVQLFFNSYYEAMSYPKESKKDSHSNYIVANFRVKGRGRQRKNNMDELMTFKEFKKSGLVNKFR